MENGRSAIFSSQARFCEWHSRTGSGSEVESIIFQDRGVATPSFLTTLLEQERDENEDPIRHDHAVKWAAGSLYGGT